VSDVSIGPKLLDRLNAAGVRATAAQVALLGSYFEILTRWNQRINLTGFDLRQPRPDAIDRLIVEPLLAAQRLLPDDRVAIDIGSGGGSPALPFKIAAPGLSMVLIEARTRRSAFLREAVRVLGLRDVVVETARFGSQGYPRLNGTVDVVTMRAVRADRDVWSGVAATVRPGGRFFWFGGPADERVTVPAGWATDEPSPAIEAVRVFRR
jgi:16S rRNA (guanine527-N7)-methyltransferase